MKVTTTILAAVAATMIGGFASAARAGMIDGTIGFSFPNGGSLFQASGVNGIVFNPPQSVNFGTGDYSGTVGSQVSLAAVIFLGSGTNATLVFPNTPEWTFIAGGKTYSFDLLNLKNAMFGPNAVSLQGSGIAHITGFKDTKAGFSLHGTGSGFTFTILQANTVVSAPDNGSAVWLLGIALVAIEGVRRLKFATAA
jgi:hypothetical protein